MFGLLLRAVYRSEELSNNELRAVALPHGSSANERGDELMYGLEIDTGDMNLSPRWLPGHNLNLSTVPARIYIVSDLDASVVVAPSAEESRLTLLAKKLKGAVSGLCGHA